MYADRVSEWRPRLIRAAEAGIFTELTVERALDEAHQAAERRSEGFAPRQLDGVMVAWKDVFDVAGRGTGVGTRFLGRRPAARDHRLVARLARRGAICVGKTSLTELAVSALGENAARPAPANPVDSGRVCGGSSSGAAAAVAHGVADVGIGTDCGGSVRLPAAWCGVVGFKPSRRFVDSRGVVPFSPSLDTVGVIASSVRLAVDTVAALTVAGSGPTDRPLSVALRRAPLPAWLGLDDAVARVWESALTALANAGLDVPEASCDPLDWAWEFRGRHGSTAAIEGAALWRRVVLDAGDLASARLRQWFTESRQERNAGDRRRARRRLVTRFGRAVAPGTVLLTPSSPIEPPALSSLADEGVYRQHHSRANALLWPFNELDAPAISIPCGHSSAGLPIGLQIAAPQGRERDVVAAAAVVEAALAGAP